MSGRGPNMEVAGPAGKTFRGGQATPRPVWPVCRDTQGGPIQAEGTQFQVDTAEHHLAGGGLLEILEQRHQKNEAVVYEHCLAWSQVDCGATRGGGIFLQVHGRRRSGCRARRVAERVAAPSLGGESDSGWSLCGRPGVREPSRDNWSGALCGLGAGLARGQDWGTLSTQW